MLSRRLATSSGRRGSTNSSIHRTKVRTRNNNSHHNALLRRSSRHQNNRRRRQIGLNRPKRRRNNGTLTTNNIKTSNITKTIRRRRTNRATGNAKRRRNTSGRLFHISAGMSDNILALARREGLMTLLTMFGVSVRRRARRHRRRGIR